MDRTGLNQVGDYAWRIDPVGEMRVAAIIFADEALIDAMDDKVREQIVNVTTLPGIVGPAYAMPDAHWGYGFPIGGVAAFAPEDGGVISAGGVGFDISCGVRLLTTGLSRADIEAVKPDFAHELSRAIPAGVGSTGRIVLDDDEMDAMLAGGAGWAVRQGYGRAEDLERTEEAGTMRGAAPGFISVRAHKRQRKEMGTLGSGNHYLEVQEVAQIYDSEVARAFGLDAGSIVVMIHCGSRGLGHQIGTEFLRDMAIAAPDYGIRLPDRELACAPIESDLGQRYLGAMRAGINCALANRQILTHLARKAFAGFFAHADLSVVYDVSHNTCKEENHVIDGRMRRVFVHRKGATRALGPGAAELPEAFRDCGQPVFIGGSMGTSSFVLVGDARSEVMSLSSACHGAGRAMSRHKAAKLWKGREVQDALASAGIIVKSPSSRGIAEEAPGAYKNVDAVVEVAEKAGLARRVARLKPVICIKG
jgi:tRNA-splicing ligase RtcB